MIDVNDLKHKLQTGVVTVNFTKVNGEARTMPCTLSENLIPKEFVPTGSNKKKTDDVLSVWCLDKNAWRSFRVDSVLKYEVKNKL